MSEKERKYSWLVNWRAANDKMRAATREKRTEDALFWAHIQSDIEERFTQFFNTDFGAYVANIL